RPDVPCCALISAPVRSCCLACPCRVSLDDAPSLAAQRHSRDVPGPIVAQVPQAPLSRLLAAPRSAQERSGGARRECDVKAVQREAQAVPACLDERLLPRPAGEKSARLRLGWQGAQHADLSRREELLRDALAREVGVV